MDGVTALLCLCVVASCGDDAAVSADAGEPDAAATPDAGPRPGDVTRLMTFGDIDDDRGQGVAVDGAGNVIVTGYFGGTADLGGGLTVSSGDLDAFLIKQSPEGTPIWERALGDWWTGGISVDANEAGEIAVAGFFWDDMAIGTSVLLAQNELTGFIAKFSADGRPVWARALGGASPAWAQTIRIDSSGDIIVAGNFEGTADFGAGEVTSSGATDIFLAKYASADGTLLWARAFGSTGEDSAWDIDLTETGAPILVGDIGGNTDFGCATHYRSGGQDAYVARFDAGDGSCTWSFPLASGENDSAHAVAVDMAGDIVVTGIFEGLLDFGDGPVVGGGTDATMYVVKYAAIDGAFRWLRLIDGPSWELAWAITTDDANNIYLAGTHQGPVDFGGVHAHLGLPGGDTFVAVYDSDSSFLWAQFPTCPGVDYGNGIAVDGRAGVIVTGGFQQNITAGDFGGESAGETDAFITRLRP